MLKSGLMLLFGTFTQLIAVIISYEFFFKYAQSHGGVNGLNPIDIVNTLIWTVIVIELIFSVYLIGFDLKNKIKLLTKQ